MDDAKRELVQNWLTRSRRDLAAARKLATGPDPFLDTAIYHCQQAGEKAIKGFLVFHDERFEKTHDIERLINIAAAHESTFTVWGDTGRRLTPYATEFLYPGGLLEPSRSAFDQALQDAQGLYDFVLSLLPGEVRP